MIYTAGRRRSVTAGRAPANGSVALPNGAYGPYAYGLSGQSTALTQFNGHDPVIGIHGTNEPKLLGTSVSHGCIRVSNTVITRLARMLPLGTPVQIAS